MNFSDISGGAARAAYRIHKALRVNDVDSTMWVNNATSGDWTISGPQTLWQKGIVRFRSLSGKLVNKLMKTENSIFHSPALLPSNWPKRINQSDADLVHLHWVGGEMMSIEDISRIQKPVVWTMHDMWAFCGAEHCTEESRWRSGYIKANRPAYEKGIDLNRWAWNRKVSSWKKPITIVTPSNWLADCVKESKLMHDWSVEVIHNPIDTQAWRPLEQKLARDLMQLPAEKKIIAFGAVGGTKSSVKGFDLLLEALKRLSDSALELELVVFGQSAPEIIPDLGFPIHYTGHLHDDVSMCLLYSAINAFILPSRIDNLPNTGVEACACGTPVVAFDIGGIPDIVDHKITGYLARAFDPRDLAQGIEWVLCHPYPEAVRQAAREKNLRSFDSKIIVNKYIKLYEKVLKQEV